MIRQLTLINFMSHEHTVLDLADGVNVLIGPNNCGKSAVVEALRAVCENSRGNYMIRHGEKQCQVIVETGEGDVIEWQRKQKNASYVINGEQIHRVRQPEDLHRLLKMPLVESRDGTDKFDLHLGLQKTPIFLLNQPDSQVATFFASASDAHYLLKMQDQHRQKVRARKNQLGNLQEQIRKGDVTLKTFKPLPNIEKQLGKLRKQHSALVAGVEKNSRLRDQLQELQKKQQKLGQLQKSEQVLRLLQLPPKLFPVEQLAEKTNSFDQLRRDVGLQKRRFSVLKQLKEPPKISNLNELRHNVLAFTKQAEQLEQYQRQERKIQENLEACREELRGYVRQQPTCPQCHRPWSEDELIELIEKGESHDA